MFTVAIDAAMMLAFAHRSSKEKLDPPCGQEEIHKNFHRINLTLLKLQHSSVIGVKNARIGKPMDGPLTENSMNLN